MRDAAGGSVRSILVLGTLGAPERRRLRGRRGRELADAEPEAVPTARATVVRPEPFAGRADAEAWLEGLRGEGAEGEVADAIAVINRALHGWRSATADPYAGDVAPSRALVARVGFGDGEAVAAGRFEQAWELPPRGEARTRRSMEAPEERFAALLGGRAEAHAGEELVLRARADLDAGRAREAALQARVALEALLTELARPGALSEQRGAVGDAANRALRGPLPPETLTALEAAVSEMESALRRMRLRG